jgi:NTE family protein
MSQHYQDQLLAHQLQAILGDIDPAALALLRHRLEWVEVPAGHTLMTQGEPGDSVYLSISGRLRAYVRGDDGTERLVREMARGQVIGEMSLFTDEPRSATVVAIRDSVLVRLSKPDFKALLATGADVAIAITRRIIQRLQSVHTRFEQERPVTIALVPVTGAVDARSLASRLAEQFQRQGSVRIVDAAAVDDELQQPGLARSDASDAADQRRIALHLDRLEAAHDFVLLVADDAPTAWTRRCSRSCDHVVLLADATQPPALHANETECLMRRPGRIEAAETLVLLHPADLRSPRGTRAWLDRRPVSGHMHIRPALERDLRRMARLLSGTGVGLVLAGGGARGLAHLGVMRALQDRGIEFDVVGGTSIGALLAVGAASDVALDEVTDGARSGFATSPTGDFNLVPMLSLISGRRARQLVQRSFQTLLGHDGDIEDLWKTCYLVSSNYTQMREEVLRRGPLVDATLASFAIPGALPPVLRDGDLLCDGGTFNNYPVDVMRRMPGVGQVIGVDLGVQARRRIDATEVPGTWALLLDRLRPRKARRYRFPSLVAYLMNVTILYSASRRHESQQLTDVYLNPPLERVGMLAWDRFDSIVEQGRTHAAQVLDALPPEKLRALGARPTDATPPFQTTTPTGPRPEASAAPPQRQTAT